MGRISEIYKYNTTPICNKEAVVQGEKYRFSILTPSLIRMEYSDNGVFEDRATSAVTNREFPVPHFEIRETEETIKIYTDHVELTYHKKHPFCVHMCTNYDGIIAYAVTVVKCVNRKFIILSVGLCLFLYPHLHAVGVPAP